VISFAGDSSDSITLVGVHASALHSTDFQLVMVPSCEHRSAGYAAVHEFGCGTFRTSQAVARMSAVEGRADEGEAVFDFRF
jgi:hypothetical protein